MMIVEADVEQAAAGWVGLSIRIRAQYWESV
jgi:hypothetical protein